MNTIEGNKLIAEFMGIRLLGNRTKISRLNYHSSWSSLKPVIDKIGTYFLTYDVEVRKIAKMSILVEIEPCWKAVVEFIEWHNKQK